VHDTELKGVVVVVVVVELSRSFPVYLFSPFIYFCMIETVSKLTKPVRLTDFTV